MSCARGVAIVVLTSSFAGFAGRSECADTYVRVSADDVPIYTLAGKGEVLGRVSRGTVLRLGEESGDWYRVSLFSGEWRFLRKRFAAVAPGYEPTPPADEALRKQVFTALVTAEDRSRNEAERLVPSSDLMRQIDVMRVLDDRYKLKAMQRFKLDPAVYRPLIVEGVQKRWRSR